MPTRTLSTGSNDSTGSTDTNSSKDDPILLGSPASTDSSILPDSPLDSPLGSPDSLFGDETYAPDLDGPKPGEIPQHRGKPSAATVQGNQVMPAIPVAQQPAGGQHPPQAQRRGGFNPTVAQAPPFDLAEEAPPRSPA